MGRDSLVAVWPPTAVVTASAGHKPMSPMQAIRRKCMDCSGGQKGEVKLCEATGCALWPFRAGRHPYTRTRLQQAVSETGTPDGTQGAQNPSPSGIGLQQASSCESEPIAARRRENNDGSPRS